MALEKFEPAFYSVEENLFLAENIGKAPAVAMARGVPLHVNPKAVRPVLERVYELMQLEEHEGQEWVGLEPLRESMRTYVTAITEWESDKRKGAPYPPPMFNWDTRGRARFGGVGSDSMFVNTYFDENGGRKKLGVALTPGSVSQKYIPEWVRRKMAVTDAPSELIINEKLGHIECPVCQFIVNFNPDDPTKINIAKAQMGKHMIKATKDPDDHKAAYGAIFRSGGQQVS